MSASGVAAVPSRLPVAAVLALAGAGVFLSALDQTVVVTALPQIFLDVEVPVTKLDQGAWIITGYLLGYTAAMPLMGRVSDIYGHGRVYFLAMVFFIAGSALVASGSGLWWVVGGRVVQAAGGGALVPVTIALAGELLPGVRRGIAIGVVVAVAEAGAVLGPLYGGLLLEALSWRWLFWINLPAGALFGAAVFAAARGPGRRGLRVDYTGGALLGASLALLSVGLATGSSVPGGWAFRGALLAASAVLLLAFAGWQARAADPLLPLSVLRKVPLAAANFSNLLIGGALILALVNIPLMSDTIMGKTPLEGGLRLLRLTSMIPAGAVIGGFLYQRWGYRLPMMAGLALAALGFGLLSRWPIDVAEPRLTLELMTGGLGFGLVVTPVTIAVLNHVRASQRATATALVTVMRMVGMIVGLSALSSWGKERFGSLVGGFDVPIRLASETESAFAERTAQFKAQVTNGGLTFFHEVFIAALIVCVLALIPAFFLGRRGSGTEEAND